MYVGLKITQHVGYVTLYLSRSLISPCLWYNPLGRRLRGREARSTTRYHEDLHKKNRNQHASLHSEETKTRQRGYSQQRASSKQVGGVRRFITAC